MEGWCCRCKQKREMIETETKEYSTKKGIKKAVSGKCAVCGCKMSVMTK